MAFISSGTLQGITVFMSVCVCVCVWVREREREREQWGCSDCHLKLIKGGKNIEFLYLRPHIWDCNTGNSIYWYQLGDKWKLFHHICTLKESRFSCSQAFLESIQVSIETKLWEIIQWDWILLIPSTFEGHLLHCDSLLRYVRGKTQAWKQPHVNLRGCPRLQRRQLICGTPFACSDSAYGWAEHFSPRSVPQGKKWYLQWKALASRSLRFLLLSFDFTHP